MVPPKWLTGRDDQGFPILSPGFTGLTGYPSAGVMRWAGQRVKVSEVLGLLEQNVGRPVIDQTGLTGLYDFRLVWESGPPRGGALSADPVPTAQDAIKALGLTLESSEAPVQMFVIDGFNKIPSAN